MIRSDTLLGFAVYVTSLTLQYPQVCTQLTKAYMAKTSRNQLLVIDSAMYVHTYVFVHQDLFASELVCT